MRDPSPCCSWLSSVCVPRLSSVSGSVISAPSTRALPGHPRAPQPTLCFCSFSPLGTSAVSNFCLSCLIARSSVVQRLRRLERRKHFPPFLVCAHVRSITSVMALGSPCSGARQALGPWHSPDENTGVRCHAPLQGIFGTQGLNPSLLLLLRGRQILYPRATWEDPLPVKLPGHELLMRV